MPLRASHILARVNANAWKQPGLWGLAFAHAVLFLIAFPPFNIWPAAFVAIMPLVAIALRSARPVRSGFIVWVVCSAMWLFMQRWLIGVTVVGWPLLAMYLALYPAAFVWIGARMAKRWPASHWRLAVALAVLWAALETLRGEFMLTGYAWFLIAHPLIETPIAQNAEVAGVYGISLALAFAQAIVALAALREKCRIRRIVQFACGGAAIGLLTLNGVSVRIGFEVQRAVVAKNEPVPDIEIAVIQTKVPQSNKVGWPIEQRLADFERMRDLTLEAAEPNRTATVRERLPESESDLETHGRDARATDFSPDLIIWPETMFPGESLSAQAVETLRASGLSYQGGMSVTYFFDELIDLQEQIGTPLLVGAIGYDDFTIGELPNGGIEFNHEAKFNSAFLVEEGAVADTRYDKLLLTPFGEVMPGISQIDWLEQLLLSIGAGGMAFDLDAGAAPVVFDVPIKAPSASEGSKKLESTHSANDTPPAVVRIATPICFEAATPRVCRRLVFADGERQADLMVNLTNDGWFGDSPGGREQHLLVARWRCIELRTPMVRAANTGVSASIDTLGRVQDRGPDNRENDWNADGVLRTHVWLPGGPPTFYARFGDVVGWTCVILAAIASLLTIQKSRHDGEINTDEERSNEEVA